MRYRGLTELVAVRHGQSTANAAYARALRTGEEPEGLPDRDAEVGLTGLGVRQARALGAGWLARLRAGERPDIVYTSPFLRARTTAALILEAAGADIPVEADERLRDREMGVFELKTPEAIRRTAPDEYERWRRTRMYYRPPGGESPADVVLRVRSCLRDLSVEHAGQRVLVVGHDATVLSLRLAVEGTGEEEFSTTATGAPVLNASVTRWTADAAGDLRLAEYNTVTHLDGIGTASEPGARPD